MKLEKMFNKLGEKNVNRWILEFCVSLFCVGIFEFFYIWLTRYENINYLKFTNNYTLTSFLVQFVQVYSVLFIPIIIYFGFKYRNSTKLNGKKMKILVNLLIIFVFSLLVYFYHSYGLWQWTFLFIPIFILISLRFNLIFAFSFSYLSFYSANMLFEFQGLNFIKNFGTLLSYIFVLGIFILILYKLKIKIDSHVIMSFLPIIFLWVYTYPIWQLKGKNFSIYLKPIDLYIRLFMFSFFIIIALKVYFAHKKYPKP